MLQYILLRMLCSNCENTPDKGCGCDYILFWVFLDTKIHSEICFSDMAQSTGTSMHSTSQTRLFTGAACSEESKSNESACLARLIIR